MPVTDESVVPQSQDAPASIFLGGTALTFPVGLEGLTLELGTRAVTTQALDQFWCDSLGPSVPTMTLTGHTGWRRKQDTGLDGKDTFFALVKLHKDHQEAMRHNPNSDVSLLVLVDGTTSLVAHCYATSLRIIRDKSRPTLFQFEWQLTVVRRFLGNQVSQNGGFPAVPSSFPQEEARQSTSRQAYVMRSKAIATKPGDVLRYTVQPGETIDSIITGYYKPVTPEQQFRVLTFLSNYPGNTYLLRSNLDIVGSIVFLPSRVLL